MEAGRKARTSERHCLVLPQTEHEQQQQDLAASTGLGMATDGLISPDNPKESHTDRKQVFRGHAVQPDVLGAFYEHKK